MLAGVVASTGLAGCARPVEVAPAVDAGHPACRAVADTWPTTVAGQPRVATTTASGSVAAWGDPPIVARCGLPMPAPSTDDCIAADGVDWLATRLEDGMRFLSYGRTPAIEVLVPSGYAPEPLVLARFAAAARQIPQGDRRCR